MGAYAFHFRHMPHRFVAWTLAACALVACGDDDGFPLDAAVDSTGIDSGLSSDSGTIDGAPRDAVAGDGQMLFDGGVIPGDGSVFGGGVSDANSQTDASVDAATDAAIDAGHDAGDDVGTDAGHDAGTDAGHDAGTDAGHDAGTDAGTDAGSATPCAAGEGRSLWHFTFPDRRGGYSHLESWDAACEYSLADAACRVAGEPHDYANWGPGVVFDSSSDYWRVRFSVAGMDFDGATLYIRAHADGSGIPQGELSSPIYGTVRFTPTVPISGHRLYAIDWSDFLSPSDSPSLPAVTLRSRPSGLAVSSIELCIQ